MIIETESIVFQKNFVCKRKLYEESISENGNLFNKFFIKTK